MEGKQKRVEKKKCVEKKYKCERTYSLPVSPQIGRWAEKFRAGGEAGSMGEPPPPAGRGGVAAAGGRSRRGGRAPAAAPSPRLCPRLPEPRSAEETGKREKGKAAKALRTRAGGARGAAGGGVRGRGGGSRRGQRGAGGSAPPPPDSLNEETGEGPSQSPLPGSPPPPGGRTPALPVGQPPRTAGDACHQSRAARLPPSTTKPRRGTPTRPDGSCGAARWHLVVQEGCMLGGIEAPGWWGAVLQPLSEGTLREGGRAAVPVPCEHQGISQGELSTGGCRMGKVGSYWGTHKKSSSTESR